MNLAFCVLEKLGICLTDILVNPCVQVPLHPSQGRILLIYAPRLLNISVDADREENMTFGKDFLGFGEVDPELSEQV